MSAPIHPEVVIPANATVVRRETFREYFDRIHSGSLDSGTWGATHETQAQVLMRFMNTMADYVDAVTRHG